MNDKIAIIFGVLKLVLKIAEWVKENGGLARLKAIDEHFESWAKAQTPEEMHEAARRRAELDRR